MAELTSLRFIKRMAPYMPDQLAGFEPQHAARIVAAGRAVYVTPPPGRNESGEPLAKEAPVKKPKPKTAPKKEPAGGMKARKTGKLGTVKK